MKPKNLTNFLNQLKTKGIRKTNQFQIVITSGHADIDKTFEDVSMWAAGAELPSREQVFVDVTYQAYPFKIPSKMTMTQEISFDMKCDSSGELRRAFLKWMSYISNPAISDGSSGEGDKKIPTSSNVRLLIYDDTMDEPVEIYKLIGVAPSEVGTMAMSNDDASIATFSVKLTYQYWELEDTTGKFNDIR